MIRKDVRTYVISHHNDHVSVRHVLPQRDLDMCPINGLRAVRGVLGALKASDARRQEFHKDAFRAFRSKAIFYELFISVDRSRF
jgi:hypothetical protein